ncbi:hypothetical protein LCGC14_1578890 [marine sediment metagenome]|uniref:Uncharacterized protein n=1 Tax=marine sediment metagenome TaxID=412755 RepID=A0A0F9KYE9_9ZZZZ
MSSFGLDPVAGFLQKMVDDIIGELEDDERAAFGAGIDVTATSVFGQLNGVFGGGSGENWEVLNEVYQSFNPNSATGAALDRLAALTGVVRLPATRSSFLFTDIPSNFVTLTGDDGTTLLAGRVVSVTATGSRFVLQADRTLALAIPRTPSTAVNAGVFRSNGGNIYVATIGGATGPGAGPTTEDEAIVDGTVTWRFIGNGLAFRISEFLAEEFGPVIGLSASLTIETPITGWSSAKNQLDATVGVDLETNAALRIRRNDLLRAQGSATIEAIRADLFDVEGVVTVIVFENDTILVDTDGRPPKSIECVVLGGTDEDVARAIFLSKAAGPSTFGFPGVAVSEVVVDSQGIPHTINFSQPITIDIYIDISIDVDAETYAGDAAVEAALKTQGDELGLGEDVIMERIKCAAFDVIGVVDITVFIIDITAIPPGTGAVNIPIAPRNLAVFDTTRIDVVSTPV